MGHEYLVSIHSGSVRGIGCPYCAGKKVVEGENDLVSLYPHISEQWHSERNGTLRATEVTPYSNRRVWWVCEKGHEYQAAVSARTAMGSGCPYCSGRKVLVGFNDLATAEPKIASQWDEKLNGALTPQMVTRGSNKKVWWRRLLTAKTSLLKSVHRQL